MAETIPCILIVRADGSKIWIAAADYKRNPEPGSYVLNEQRKVKRPR